MKEIKLRFKTLGIKKSLEETVSDICRQYLYKPITELELNKMGNEIQTTLRTIYPFDIPIFRTQESPIIYYLGNYFDINQIVHEGYLNISVNAYDIYAVMEDNGCMHIEIQDEIRLSSDTLSKSYKLKDYAESLFIDYVLKHKDEKYLVRCQYPTSLENKEFNLSDSEIMTLIKAITDAQRERSGDEEEINLLNGFYRYLYRRGYLKYDIPSRQLVEEICLDYFEGEIK